MSTESNEPGGSVNNRLFSIVYIGMFAALVIVGSYIGFRLPGAPDVPVTLQTLFVGLAGILLGPLRGFLAVLLFLVLGAVGLPVFSGGVGGLQTFMGKTGGYLVGFALGALISGLVYRGFLKAFRIDPAEVPAPVDGVKMGLATAVAMLAGFIVVYLPGVPWLQYVLSQNAPVSLEVALGYGLVPFIPGDILKILAAAILVPFVSRLIKE